MATGSGKEERERSTHDGAATVLAKPWRLDGMAGRIRPAPKAGTRMHPASGPAHEG